MSHPATVNPQRIKILCA